MALTAKHRIAEVQGQSVRVMQKARRNARVVPVDLATGQEIGESFLVASDKLANIRGYETAAEISRSIRIPNRVHEQLSQLAKPFQTPAEVIEELIKRNAARVQRETGA